MHLSLGSHQVTCLFCLAMLLCAFTSGQFPTDHKKTACCTPAKLRNKIKQVPKPSQIKECFFVSATSKCVKAVMFRVTNRTIRCMDPKTPMLHEKLKALEANGIRCQNKTKS